MNMRMMETGMGKNNNTILKLSFLISICYKQTG